jgi:hypothetical protein
VTNSDQPERKPHFHIFLVEGGLLRPAIMMGRHSRFDLKRDRGGIYRGNVLACWLTDDNAVKVHFIVVHHSNKETHDFSRDFYWLWPDEARRLFPGDPALKPERHVFTDEEKEGY